MYVYVCILILLIISLNDIKKKYIYIYIYTCIYILQFRCTNIFICMYVSITYFAWDCI